MEPVRLNGPSTVASAVIELLRARAAEAAEAAPPTTTAPPADPTSAHAAQDASRGLLAGALQPPAAGAESTLHHMAAQSTEQPQWQAAQQRAGAEAGWLAATAPAASAALLQAAQQTGAPATQLEAPLAALAATPMPQAGSAVPDAVALPVMVNTLQTQAMQFRPVQRREDDLPPPQRERRAPWRGGEDEAPAPAVALDDDDEAPAPAKPADDAHEAPRLLFRALRGWLQVQPGSQPLCAELAQRRRVLLAAPFERVHAPPGSLQLFLLCVDARGQGVAWAYRARGAPALVDERTGTEPPVLRCWRVHRERSGDDAQPRLVAARVGAPTLSIRLAAAALPPPLHGPHDAWLDVIDARRLWRDLGPQWSVLIGWSAQAVPGLARP